MSLLSKYNGIQYPSGLDSGLQVLTTANLCSYFGGLNASAGGSFTPTTSINNDTDAIYQYAGEPASDGLSHSFVKTDFANKQTTWISGQNYGTSVSSNYAQPILHNPFNGGIIMQNIFDSSGDSIWTSNSSLNSWSKIIVGHSMSTGAQLYPNTGYWYDGTTFALAGNFYFHYSTDGSSWNTTSRDSNLKFIGNNRSNYSGYCFSGTASARYYYRTSITGTDTTVEGYALAAMSPNGRYCWRQRSSTPYTNEYSTDGGASWTIFPTTVPGPGASVGGHHRRFITDAGQFMACNGGGLFFQYNFTTNTWVGIATLTSLYSITSGAEMKMGILNHQGKPFLLCDTYDHRVLTILDCPIGF